MEKKSRIGGYFLALDENKLAFESPNELKSSVMQIFVVLFGIMVFAEILVIIERYETVFREISQGEGLVPFYFMASTLILLVIWFFLPPKRIHLDRLNGVVHHKQGKRTFVFSWDRIRFSHQWFPTKTGGATLFTLFATPPFPEELGRVIEKKRLPPQGQFYNFNLGSFDVKGPEHGQAIFSFLDAWMHSREPAESLYESMVVSQFGI